MTISEAVLEITRETFEFLVTEYLLTATKEVLGASYVGLQYRGKEVILRFGLDSDIFVQTELVPLVGGEEPRRFDPDLREHRTHLFLTDAFDVLEPRSTMPTTPAVRDADDITKVLSEYAALLRTHARAILGPRPDFLRQVHVKENRRTLLRLLASWAEFVEEVSRGYQSGIVEYVGTIGGRATLEDMTDWSDPFTAESRRQLVELDAIFDRSTEPVTWGAGQLNATPRAARWWRKPLIMSDEMRREFRMAFG